MKLKIAVKNIQKIYPSKKAGITVTAKGAIFGSGDDLDWSIQDIDGNIQETHGVIGVADGRFTIAVYPHSKIYMNGSKSSIAKNRQVLLKEGDIMRIGDLECEIRLNHGMKDIERENAAAQIMEHDENGHHDHIVIDGNLVYAEERNVMSETNYSIDPLSEFEDLPEKRMSEDPLALMDQDRPRKKMKGIDMRENKEFEDVQPSAPDFSDTNVAAISNRKIQRDSYGFEADVDDTSYNFYYTDPKHEGDVDQDTLRMLALNLGVPFHDLLPDDAPLVIADIGKSLNEAVAGLNHLFVSRSGKAHRFPLATMHIHAIEDNPLKFSESTEEALDSMFVNRGEVHLSAPAAIAESLRHLDQHQKSTEQAIDKGLNAVMGALHPRALEKRFAQYSRGRAPAEGVERDAWKWKMFQAYVTEMTSRRQTGLKMLFWEVFSSAYQDAMRQFEAGMDVQDDQGE